MLYRHIEALRQQDSQEVVNRLSELLTLTPELLLQPQDLLTALTGEVAPPEPVTFAEGRERLLNFLASHPDQEFSFKELSLQLNVNFHDTDFNRAMWDLISKQEIELTQATRNLKFKSKKEATV